MFGWHPDYDMFVEPDSSRRRYKPHPRFIPLGYLPSPEAVKKHDKWLDSLIPTSTVEEDEEACPFGLLFAGFAVPSNTLNDEEIPF